MTNKADWNNAHVVQWVQYLLDSYAFLAKQELIARDGTAVDQAERLFNSPVVVASHDLQHDPILNYGNQMALDLWEMNWNRFTQTPSRLTAEPVHRQERARMLEQAKTQGYISNYRGVRLSRTGRRFVVDQATIWTIQKSDGTPLGQGATFSAWTYL